MAPLLPVLRSAGIMDVPNVRSSHNTPTPRGGGAAVMVGIVAAMGAGVALGHSVNWWVVAGVLVFSAVGLADDLRGLAVTVRLAAQFALAAVLASVVIGGGLIPPHHGPALILGSVWLVAYTNAFNFMDGVNGISALNAALAGGWYCT